MKYPNQNHHPGRRVTIAALGAGLVAGAALQVAAPPQAAAECRRLCADLTTTTIVIQERPRNTIPPFVSVPPLASPPPRVTVPPLASPPPTVTAPPLVTVPDTKPPYGGPKGTIPSVTFPSATLAPTTTSTTTVVSHGDASGGGAASGSAASSPPATSPRRTAPTTTPKSVPDPSASVDDALAEAALVAADGVRSDVVATNRAASADPTNGLGLRIGSIGAITIVAAAGLTTVLVAQRRRSARP